MGDAENGKRLFVRLCVNCHSMHKGARHKMGPNLYGIVGRKAGTIAGYSFTEKMRNADVTWSENNLDKYLELPKQFLPGTRMAFNGVRNADDRRDIIAYLKTLK